MAERSLHANVRSQENPDTKLAPTPAAISCRRCRCRHFFAQLAQGGTFLVLTCAECSEPLLFSVSRLSDFANPREIVIDGGRDAHGFYGDIQEAVRR